MKPTRRDLFTLGGGAAAGALFTPVPWKLLDDVSIWTQNWPWIPQPPRGPVEVKSTVCTLCPNACGMKVRLVAGSPVGVAGATEHPVSRGALCPLAYGAHQLNWHPRRLRRVLHRGRESSWESAAAALRKACADGPVSVVDGRAGRAVSAIFERFADGHGGRYSVVRSVEEKALAPYERWTGAPAGSLGYDLENARTVVSFGAPLLDGWSVPGRFARLWAERTAGQDDPALRLIQIEPELSRTAAAAWRWVPIREGGEAALAAGIARVLIEDRLVAATGPVPSMPRDEAARTAGVPVEAIAELARTIVELAPVVVIAREDNPAVAALNVVLGAVGARGGVVARARVPAAPALVPAPDFANRQRAARAVVVDATVPWDFQPEGGGEVFRFAAWDGGGSKADWLLPSPGFLEETTDVPTAPGSAVETYAVATKLVTPAHEVHSAGEFLTMCDPKLPSVEITPPEGDVRVGEPPEMGGLRCELNEWPESGQIQRRSDWTEGWTPPVLPPLASKLYAESRLREKPGRRIA